MCFHRLRRRRHRRLKRNGSFVALALMPYIQANKINKVAFKLQPWHVYTHF